MLLPVLLLLLLVPLAVWAEAPCTHYASPTGTGATCTKAQPCKVSSFWPLAAPGNVLCLTDGTYRGESSMIRMPPGVRGTATQPLTIRAEHDGQVTLDAQHSMAAVAIGWHDGEGADNAWVAVEGVNATNGGQDGLIVVAGSHSVVRRVIGYHGTSGAYDANIFRVTGYNARSEDCAGWGMNSRKIFDGAQSGNLHGAGFRRCWGEWNDWPQGGANPTNTYQVGYNTTNQLFENVIGTWDSRGQIADIEGVMGLFHNAQGQPNSLEGTRVLGSLLYLRPGATFQGAWLFQAGGASDTILRDVAAVLPPGSGLQKTPFMFMGCNPGSGAGSCRNNVCQNCLAVHDGTASINQPNSGWSTPGWHEGRDLEAATGGRSAFELLPGLCYRYENGELTNKPLWPFPMNERIKAARLVSGSSPVDVTAEVERVLGPIPAACKGGGGGPPDPPDPPAATPLTCTGVQGSGGLVAIACMPQAAR